MSVAVKGDPPSEVFSALGDQTRWSVLALLAERGEATATELAAELPVSRPAVIKHLGVLGRVGLVERRPQGREVRFAVRTAALDSAASWLETLAAEWDRRLARLKRFAEAEERP